MHELFVRDDNKKQRLLALAKILRETDAPQSGKALAASIGVTRSTITRYINILDNHLEGDEKLVVTNDEDGTLFYKLECASNRYDNSKTEEGYSDPTAAKAMNGYIASDTVIKDWKYNPGDIWLTKSRGTRYEKPFLIIGVYSDSALCVKAYEEQDVLYGAVDQNDPNLVEVGHWTIDTSVICTKKFDWLTVKSGSLDDEGLADVKHKIARTLHICDSDEVKALSEELKTAEKEIEDLSKALNETKGFKHIPYKESVFDILTHTTVEDLHKEAINAIFGQTDSDNSHLDYKFGHDPKYWDRFNNAYLRGQLMVYRQIFDKIFSDEQ